ncbi:MAG TPA: pyridoxamine 5'-phosphate oxidase family protein, partial [Bdellovibrio sp.]|nr:pyridoxamine 5'-phosphate oxidase family protein [Bdellovibrio sp.]
MENKTASNTDPNIRKLGELLHGIRVAMLTTFTEDHRLHSGPLMVQEFDFDGDLWFLISRFSTKISDIQKNPQVCLSFSSPLSGKYISASGTAELWDDPGRVSDIWCQAYEPWFPEGPRDNNIQLLRVNIESAEYWETHASSLSRILHFVNGHHGK